MRKILLILSILLLSGYHTSGQNTKKLFFQIGIGSNAYSGSNNNVLKNFNNGFALHTGVNYYLNTRLSLGGNIIINAANGNTSDTTNVLKYSSFGLHPYIRYDFLSLAKGLFVFYGSLGTGLHFNTFEITNARFPNLALKASVNSFELSPGLGVDIKLGKRLSLFLEAKYDRQFYTTDIPNRFGNGRQGEYMTYLLGLRIKLGKANKTTVTTATGKTKVNLIIIDDELPILLDGTIQTKDSSRLSVFAKDIKRERVGKYSFELENGSSYEFVVSKKYYESKNFTIDLTNNNAGEVEKTVNLKPIKKPYILNTFNADNLEFIISNLEVANLQLDEKLTPELTRDNQYAINLREGNKYRIEAKSAKGYFFYTETIEVEGSMQETASNQTTKSSIVKIPIQPLKIGKKLQLKDILYKYNSEELIESSYDELNRVINLMKLNPTLVIEIGAHTDESGTTDYNQKLSERRAKFVADYIIKNGVAPEKLQTKGYGKSKPLVPNDTEDNKQKNRRLELLVLKYN